MDTNEALEIERSPGKFEGEMKGIHYLWEEMVLNGNEDEVIYEYTSSNSNRPISVFFRDMEPDIPILSALFSEYDESVYALCLWETEEGFVCSMTYSKENYEELKRQLNGEEEVVDDELFPYD